MPKITDADKAKLLPAMQELAEYRRLLGVRAHELEQEAVRLTFFPTQGSNADQIEESLEAIREELGPLYEKLGIDKMMNPLFNGSGQPPDLLR